MNFYNVFRKPTRRLNYFAARSLYMFRLSPEPIIRSTQIVVATTGTSHVFEDKIPLKRVHGRAASSLWSWPN